MTWSGEGCSVHHQCLLLYLSSLKVPLKTLSLLFDVPTEDVTELTNFQWMCQSLFPGNKWKDKRCPQVALGEVWCGCLEKFLHLKGYQALEQPAQGSGWVTSLEEFKRCIDVALRDMVWWWTSVRLIAVLNTTDITGLFKPKCICDSVWWSLLPSSTLHETDRSWLQGLWTFVVALETAAKMTLPLIYLFCSSTGIIYMHI